jgi:hypothetical protein
LLALQQLSWRNLGSGVLEALQQTKQGHNIPEEQVALNMKFTIAILSDWQVTLLLTPDHV